MSFANYYSYLREEDEENSIFFQFITKDNNAYTVYFKIDDYTQYIDEFPLLLQKGYSFGIRRQKFSTQRKNFSDPLVFSTIYRIVLDFFESNGNETILLYHCDHSDGKEVYRNKLFENWERKISHINALEKHSIEVQVGEKDFFLGFITLPNNPLIDDIKAEFEAFSFYIIQPKE